MARMKFICDSERCIECNGCVTACKNEHEVPWGVNRRRVVTLNDGVPGEKSISVACMHCSGRALHGGLPGAMLLPHRRGRGAARQGCLHRLRLLQLRLSVRRAAVPGPRAPSACAARWTSAPSAPVARRRTVQPGRVREVRPQPPEPRASCPPAPRCARPRRCWAGDGDVVADIFRTRVIQRGKGSEVWGWGTAYGQPKRRRKPGDARHEAEAADPGRGAAAAFALLGLRRASPAAGRLKGPDSQLTRSVQARGPIGSQWLAGGDPDRLDPAADPPARQYGQNEYSPHQRSPEPERAMTGFPHAHAPGAGRQPR